MGDFIAASIINEFAGNDTPIDVDGTNYISSVISGGFANLVNVTGFKASMLFVGLNRVVFDAVDRETGGEGLEPNTLIRSFIIDSISVYFIIQILDQIINTFSDNEDSFVEEPTFGERVLWNIFYGIFINIFLYALMADNSNIRNSSNDENMQSKKASISWYLFE